MLVPLAYVAMILVWATTPITIKISSESVPVVIAALSRVVIGAALGLALSALLRVRVPWHRHAWRTYLFGNVNVFIGVFLTFKGAQHLPSGMVSVLFGLSPVMSAIFSRFFLDEKPLTPSQWMAAIVGLFGLVLVFREQLQISGDHIVAVFYILGAVMCFIANNMLLKLWPGTMSALSQTTGTLILGVPLYIGLAVTQGVILPEHLLDVVTSLPRGSSVLEGVSERSLYAMIYLGIFGSLLGVMCYFFALTHLSAATVALATLITPIIALSIGRWLNHEILTAGEMAGALCIIGALVLYYFGGGLAWRLRKREEEVKHGVL